MDSPACKYVIKLTWSVWAPSPRSGVGLLILAFSSCVFLILSPYCAFWKPWLVEPDSTSGMGTGTWKRNQPRRLSSERSGGERREIPPVRWTMQVLGKYTPVDLSIRVTKGQNPSKHAEYMQVLKTLMKSSGVLVSQSAFKDFIFC